MSRQQAAWTSEDVTAVQTIGNILGPVRVLSHEETHHMTEQAPEDFTGSDDNGWAEATGAKAPTATYPEYSYSLADHVYTWSPKLPDGSMLVIRAQSADGLVEAVESITPLAGRLTAAWASVTGRPAAAPQAPAQQPWQQQPAQPVPNQPYPGQPAWQQAGAQQAPQQWAPPAPQGGAQVPQGWYKLTVPFPQKAAFDGIVQQYGLTKGDPFKGGQVSWQKGVKSWFCAPEVAQAFAQFNPIVSQ